MLAPLAQAIAAVAPGITLEVVPWSAQTLTELESPRLDLAIDAESVLLENFHFKILYKERYGCLLRQRHPLLAALRQDGSVEPKKAAAYPQVLLLYPVGDRLESDNVLDRLGFAPERIAMRTPYFATVPKLLSGTDTIALVPTRPGILFAQDAPLVLVPLHAKTEFHYRLIWHERTQQDRLLQWLRGEIYKVIRSQIA